MSTAATIDPEDLAYAGAVGQLELLRSGRVNAVELLEVCLARIDRFDGDLNAFRTVFRDAARAQAQAADAERAAGGERTLLGLPVAVKDNVHVQGHRPSMGTGSVEPPAPRDAEQVRRLRAAGAVVVGTTHLPELALWPFTESQTWGVTRNPWNRAHSVGGSSGGSAAAVAAGLVAAATASDGGGSIRIPAAHCGLVGLKPQRGRVPLGDPGDEHAEHWYGLSVAGVLTRSVADQALLLSVLTDGAVTLGPEPSALRIAWSVRPPIPAPVSAEQQDALQATCDVLRSLGHTVVQADPDHGRTPQAFVPLYLRGARQDLAALADPAATEPRTRLAAAAGRLVPDALLARARAQGAREAQRLAVLPGGADVLLTPVLAGPPPRTGTLTGRRTLALAGRVAPFTPAWNVTGQPALSVPAGRTAGGLPLAVQLVGRPDEEALLLAVAAQLEAATSFTHDRPDLR